MGFPGTKRLADESEATTDGAFQQSIMIHSYRTYLLFKPYSAVTNIMMKYRRLLTVNTPCVERVLQCAALHYSMPDCLSRGDIVLLPIFHDMKDMIASHPEKPRLASGCAITWPRHHPSSLLLRWSLRSGKEYGRHQELYGVRTLI